MSGGHRRTDGDTEASGGPTVQELVERARAESTDEQPGPAAAPPDTDEPVGQPANRVDAAPGTAPDQPLAARHTPQAAPSSPPGAAPRPDAPIAPEAPVAGPPSRPLLPPVPPRRPATGEQAREQVPADQVDGGPAEETPHTSRPARPAAVLPPAPYRAAPPLASPSAQAFGTTDAPIGRSGRGPGSPPPAQPRPAAAPRGPVAPPVPDPDDRATRHDRAQQGDRGASGAEQHRGPATRVSPLGAALAPPRPDPGQESTPAVRAVPGPALPTPGPPVLPATHDPVAGPPPLPTGPSVPAAHPVRGAGVPAGPGGSPDQAVQPGHTPLRERFVPSSEETQLIPVLPPVPVVHRDEDTSATELREGRPGGSRGILRAAGTMAVASLVSRVTGLVRTIVIAAVLGVGLVNDTYQTVNTLPNIVYELLIGGVLTSVIVPLLVRAQENDRDGGVGYAQRLTTVAMVGLTVMTALAVLAAPLLTRAYGISGDPDQVALANWLARILLLEIAFYGLGALATAILNARGVFGWPAWAPVLNNLVVMATGVLFVLAGGPGDLTPVTITGTQVWLLGVGTTLGIAVQAIVLVPQLRKVGVPLRPRWGLRGTGLREAGSLGLWVIGYVAVSQIGVLIATRVANAASREGGLGPSAFGIASLLFQMPYGIIGVALLTALVPRMSRAASRQDVPGVAADLSLGLRLSATGLLPVTALLVVLGPALTTVAFSIGRTAPADATAIGVALSWGAFGLLPMAVTLLQLRVFYAMKDARTPTLIQVAMVAVRVPLLLAVPALVEPEHVIAGLMVVTSLTYLTGWVVGDLALRRRLGALRTGDAAAPVLKLFAVSVVAGSLGWGVLAVTTGTAPASVVGSLAALVVGTVVIGTAVVVGVVLAKVPEVSGPVAAIRSRLGRARR